MHDDCCGLLSRELTARTFRITTDHYEYLRRSSFPTHQEAMTDRILCQRSSGTHHARLTAGAEHLVALEQVVSHELADAIRALPPSLQNLHLSLRRRLPFIVVHSWINEDVDATYSHVQLQSPSQGLVVAKLRKCFIQRRGKEPRCRVTVVTWSLTNRSHHYFHKRRGRGGGKATIGFIALPPPHSSNC